MDQETLDAMQKVIEQEVLPAVRSEGQKMAAGVRDAVAILLAVTCAATGTKRSKFIAALREGARALDAEGNAYAASVLEGACKRLESK
ncbi:MAG: hypothetical protein AABZ67_17055 [Pseudomonadota bacterium]